MASSDVNPQSSLVVAVQEDYATLKDAWLTLEVHAKDPFCSYAWCSSWYQSIASDQGRRPYVVTVKSASGELLMLLPLIQEKKMGMKVLARPARLISGDYGAIFAPSLQQTLDGPTMKSLWARLAKSMRGIDALIVNGVTVRPQNPMRHLPHLPASAPAFALRLQSDWDAQYDEIFNTKMKRNDRRSIKRIHEAGDVKYLRPQEVEAQQKLLSNLLEQKRAQIEATGESHHLDLPEVQDFYRRLPAAFAQSQAFDLSLTALSLDGQLIASSCGIAGKENYFGMFMAMDGGPTRKFSPGRLLLLEINRHLCEQGIKSHEFGLGEYKYKDAWNCDRYERVTVTAPTSLLGRIAMPIAQKLLEKRRVKAEEKKGGQAASQTKE